LFTYTVVVIVTDVLKIVCIFVIMLYISPPLTLVLFPMAPLVIFIVIFFNGKIIPIYVEVRKRTADIFSFLEEYLRGTPIIQAFSQEKRVSEKLNSVNKSKLDVEYPGKSYSCYFGYLIFFLSIVATTIVLGVGGVWTMKSPETLTIGTLVAFLSYIDHFFGPIFHLSEQVNVIQRAFAGAQRINGIMEKKTTGYEEGDYELPLLEDKKEGIEFKNIWFAYNEEEWVLKDISFFLPRGKRLAIVGPTGGGKTTLTNLLFRFYTPQKGEILLDGVNIQTIPVNTLRKKLGLVLQDIILFPGTVLENLRLESPEIPESKVVSALENVNAQDLVEKLSDGLNTTLSEHGKNLSMGERQLLSFARAIVFDPEILVLDEATSSIDPMSEQKIQNAIKNILKGRTSVIIAHRLQTIMESDKIIVIKDGKIKERGNHKELLEIKGTYFNLYQLQNGRV